MYYNMSDDIIIHFYIPVNINEYNIIFTTNNATYVYT